MVNASREEPARPGSSQLPQPKQMKRPADKALHAPVEDKGRPAPQAERHPPR